ncbi:monocarboxylate permease-like protein [Moniliophthora roreri]|nr:monocarboxylate permease-like protein [Moniliophthora roreri]
MASQSFTKELADSEDDPGLSSNTAEGSIPTGDVEKSTTANCSSFAPPDGGISAWLTVLGTTLISFGTFGYGAFSDYYKREYLSTYSPTLVSMIGSLQVFVLYVCFAGAVFDAIGPRYLVPGSGIVVVFSLFMLSLTKPQQIWQQFLCQAVLFSLGATFSFFPSVGLIPHWFSTKLPYAIGFLTAGASAGGIVLPIMLSRLIPRVGFGWTIRIIAFIVLFCFVVATLTVKGRRPTKPLPPFHKLFDFGAFRQKSYVLLALGCWLSVFAVFNPFFYVGLYGSTANPGSSLNPYYLAILCATSIAGRTLPGVVAIYVGRFNVMCISTLISSVLILALWYTSAAEANLAAFAALYGFFSGPFFALMPSCVSQISPIDKVGARIGGTYAFMAPATFAGTPITGIFIRSQTIDNFQNLILFSGVVSLIGTALLFASRFLIDRRILSTV